MSARAYLLWLLTAMILLVAGACFCSLDRLAAWIYGSPPLHEILTLPAAWPDLTYAVKQGGQTVGTLSIGGRREGETLVFWTQSTSGLNSDYFRVEADPRTAAPRRTRGAGGVGLQLQMLEATYAPGTVRVEMRGAGLDRRVVQRAPTAGALLDYDQVLQVLPHLRLDKTIMVSVANARTGRLESVQLLPLGAATLDIPGAPLPCRKVQLTAGAVRQLIWIAAERNVVVRVESPGMALELVDPAPTTAAAPVGPD